MIFTEIRKQARALRVSLFKKYRNATLKLEIYHYSIIYTIWFSVYVLL